MWFSKHLFFICLKLCFHVSRFLQEKKFHILKLRNPRDWDIMALDTSGKRLERSFEMSNSLWIYLDLWFYGWIWTLKRLSLPFFLKEDFSNKIDGWHFCHMQKTPPKIQQKPPRYQPARSESRHHHHHGIHTCPKRTQPFHLPYYWLSAPWNHWRDPNENEYASSGSSSLKKRGRNMTYVWKFVIARLHLASFQASSANCGGSHHGWQEWQHYWYQQCLSLIDTL